MNITKESSAALRSWLDGAIDAYMDGTPISRRAAMDSYTLTRDTVDTCVSYAWHGGWEAGRKHLIETAPTPAPRVPYGWVVMGMFYSDKEAARRVAHTLSATPGESLHVTEVYL
jgi:hypothetical protein